MAAAVAELVASELTALELAGFHTEIEDVVEAAVVSVVGVELEPG